jgi:hypothetical protein
MSNPCKSLLRTFRQTQPNSLSDSEDIQTIVSSKKDFVLNLLGCLTGTDVEALKNLLKAEPQPTKGGTFGNLDKTFEKTFPIFK